MKAKQRINVNGKRFQAGDDLSSLSADDLALIPKFAIEGLEDDDASIDDKPEPTAASFKPMDKLNKADLTALATSINIEVGEDDTKAKIIEKIGERVGAVNETIADQSRVELIESLEVHFEGSQDDDVYPHFAAMRDEELKVLLDDIMFVNLGEEKPNGE